MINSSFGPVEQTIPIPEIFKTHVSEESFQNCIACETELLKGNQEYFIEKAYKNGQVEFEYAICNQCAFEMQQFISMESMRKLMEYFQNHIDIAQRVVNMKNTPKPAIEPWIASCLFKNTPVDKTGEYQVCGHFKGDLLLFSHMPYAISGEAIEEITEILSPTTKEEMDDFMDKHFGLPPEWKEILKTRKPILV